MKRGHVRKLNIKRGHVTQCCICGESVFLDIENPVYVKTRRKTELYAHVKCFKETQKNDNSDKNETANSD